jgi:hypothetical protein
MAGEAAAAVAAAVFEPWGWRSDKGPWFAALGVAIEGWAPHPALALDAAAIRCCLAGAAAENRHWLVHPCLNPVTQGGPERRLQRDFQLAAWAACHDESVEGTVEVPERLVLWSPAGSYAADPGRYQLPQLAGLLRGAAWPHAIALDVFCGALGQPVPGSWAALPDSSPAGSEELRRELTRSLQILALARGRLPACLDWAADAAQVLVPLRSEGAGYFRSGSQPDLPGVIYADLFGGLTQVMEAIVHEAAHLHLFMAEAGGPLVDPAHQGRYRSPLRPEPRPLRGILLAYHAIAYICLFYREAIAAGLGDAGALGAELATMAAKRRESEAVLVEQRRHLTPAGDRFLDLTLAVAGHGE